MKQRKICECVDVSVTCVQVKEWIDEHTVYDAR
jgi:hypothetical protein